MDEDLIERRRKVLQGFFDARPRQQTAICRQAGVSESTIRDFLKGKNKSLQMDTYDKLAEAAGVNVLELLGEISEPKEIEGPFTASRIVKSEVLIRPGGKIVLQFWSEKGVEAEISLNRRDARSLAEALGSI